MTRLDTTVTWVDARERLPRRGGTPVAVATTGRYPPESAAELETGVGEEFWLVRPMVFATLHFAADGTEQRNCFVDSDGYAYDLDSDEVVTHWAELPALPGRAAHLVLGEDVQPALRDARDARPAG
ncbi:amine oxidase [Streptomyces sp. LP05-1]|uniref:Amine oxidase n=1 Tax=Streptomyces pyxinae TaxID=2970734 RepID=A0ABT2CHB7_9ACTN|nr:AQJ64_40280 family protein [Streptomyces sp. LP05-1]MCS0636805.1 amine oxidase [Streptomyces sp. LP05-1]